MDRYNVCRMTGLGATLPARHVRWWHSISRASQWWSHKIPPVVGAAGFAVLLHPGDSEWIIWGLALLIASAIGLATFGHLLNDWCDMATDARAGKPNRLAETSVKVRALVLTVAVIAGLVPWVWLPLTTFSAALLGVEVLLFVLYSVPPVRLKERGTLGVLADAGYAYVVPFLLAASISTITSADAAGLIALATWGAAIGCRSILFHQLEDLDGDLQAGVRTAAVTLGPERITSLVRTVLLPVEAISLIVLGILARSWILTAVVLLAGLYRVVQVSLLGTGQSPGSFHQDDPAVRVISFQFANPLVEQWFPAGVWLAYALVEPRGWWVFAALILLFDSPIKQLLLRDAPFIPDAITRAVLSGIAPLDVRKLREDGRHLDLSQTRDRAPGDPGRRWVFVVCGSTQHLATLERALRHLRSASGLPVWLVTDSRRNDCQLPAEAFDKVVDVAVPDELDHHQASIWLKTSLSRHVGEGSWCYLDSDVLAMDQQVDQIFDQPRDVVAFASDLTVNTNCIDRFSPWAMNCSCSGMDLEHSCGHLREQLDLRLDVRPPGDWTHWNGGVFTFDRTSGPFFEMWHDIAVTSFGWDEWKTRDQGALIATVWRMGLQDAPRLDLSFNFIADTGNADLVFLPNRGWAHHPAGPWLRPHLMHLYASPLEESDWELIGDLEEPILRRSHVRLYRWRRAQAVIVSRNRLTRLTYRSWMQLKRLLPHRIYAGVMRRYHRYRGHHSTVAPPSEESTA